ncbi:hypothetical protein BJX61DRAFT_151780 [Aspergillus egyptiacus]|nr:hypothetical protein BJX61DRAFT_151780 [Aspergillus egyptiacus]
MARKAKSGIPSDPSGAEQRNLPAPVTAVDFPPFAALLTDRLTCSSCVFAAKIITAQIWYQNNLLGKLYARPPSDFLITLVALPSDPGCCLPPRDSPFPVSPTAPLCLHSSVFSTDRLAV